MENNLNLTEQIITAEFDSVDVSIKLGRLVIKRTNTDVASLSYTKVDGYTITAEINDGALTVRSVDTRSLFRRILPHIPEVTLCLSEKEYKALSVHLTTGKLSLNGIKAESLEIRNTTTKVWLTDTALKECATVAVITGKVCVTNMKCKRLAVRTGCGSVALDGVFADERIDVKTTTGSIALNNSDAPKSSFNATTGRIKGKLLSFD